MKSILVTSLCVLLCLCTVPLIAYPENAVFTEALSTVSEIEKNKEEVIFRIKTDDGKIKKIGAEEYITGVLCGEVPSEYETEALKAQAVAAYSFALYRKAKAADRDYDLTSSPKTDQCYTDKETAIKKSGEESYNIMKSAVKSVAGEYLCYDGKPALAVYHAISSGKTESAKNVWGSDYPYLRSVDSAGDKLSAGYLSEVAFSAEEISEKLKSISESAGADNAFSDIKTTESGRVSSIKYNGVKVSGGEISSLLGLRSANFTVDFQNGSYLFCVRGYGHGVGMSQEGAQYLAKQGSSYKEILLHYYKGCEIK